MKFTKKNKTKKNKRSKGGFPSFSKLTSLSSSSNTSNTNTNTNAVTDINPGIGNLSFITFIGTIMARLTYLKDCGFINRYMQIFGDQAKNPNYYKSIVPNASCDQYTFAPVFEKDGKIIIQPYPIPTNALNAIRDSKIEEIFDDGFVFKNKGVSLYTNNSDKKEYVNIIPFAKHVNYVNGEVTPNGVGEYVISEEEGGNSGFDNNDENIHGGANPETNDINDPNEQVKYISIAWSNYSIVYIVADKRMNSIWVCFRGTASVKSATSYLNTGALSPKKVCDNGDGYLSGVFKITTEQIHTLLESVRYLTTSFLKPSQPESVKVFTSGHSLGGGMCTIFSYLWIGIRNDSYFSNNGYEFLTKKIVCLSIASPRVINKVVCDKYQQFIKNKIIMYKRVITKGDPVPDLPLQTQGFIHPSNGIEDSNDVVNYCENLSSFITGKGLSFFSKDASKQQESKQVFVDYTKPLNCIRKKPSAVLYSSIRNPLAHPFYLYLSFFKVAYNFTAGEISRVNPSSDTESYKGTGGDTICRVVLGGSSSNRKVGFFNSLESRGKKSNDGNDNRSMSEKLTKKFVTDTVSQDISMTTEVFRKLIDNMSLIDSPTKDPSFGKVLHIFDSSSSVGNVNCLSGLKGGIKTRKNRNTKNKTKKRK